MYKVSLDNFEGPIDLLLYFIRRDEIDIYDIPISTITKEFVDTIEAWTQLKMYVAGEFIVMASSLMRIKAKMLLPRPELDEEGIIIDPRTELMQQLIEYKRFKDAAAMLSSLSDNRSHNFHRQSKQIINSDEGEVIENLFQDTSLFDIARIFKNAMENRPVISQFELQSEPVKLEEQKKFIFRYFDGDGRVKFSTLLSKLHSRIEIVVTFLAILDLVREGVCTFSQCELFGDLELFHMGVEA